MARVEIPPLSKMTEEERQVCEETIAGKRGHLPLPMTAWLKSPEYGRRVQKVGEFLRYQTSLTPGFAEMAILLVARDWSSHYEWYVHKKDALAKGLDPAVIEAIAARRRPAISASDGIVIYDVARSVLDTKQIPDDLYRRGIAEIGERGMVELVGLLGFYTLVSMTLNSFELGLPPGVEPEF